MRNQVYLISKLKNIGFSFHAWLTFCESLLNVGLCASILVACVAGRILRVRVRGCIYVRLNLCWRPRGSRAKTRKESSCCFFRLMLLAVKSG